MNAAAAAPVYRIGPERGWVGLRLRELWEYRELLYFLTWRDIKVRYKQTALGAAWAVLQPLATMAVFTLFFGRLARVSSDGLPYPLFSFAALTPWMFFAGALGHASNSLVGSANLIRKVYFPRLVIPVSAAAGGVVDFLLSFGVLVAMMAAYGVAPTVRMAWVAPLAGLALVSALGAGLWLAALNVQFRDVRYVVPFLAQFWMFCTPVVYSSSRLPEPWKTVYGLNPMAGVVEGFRWALLGSGPAPGPMVAASAAAAALMLVSGAFYFRRVERKFADLV
jgi:lipopolysaccharide transport system permease protein